jgi:nicotinamide mononucleotide (NMN) deamidase PncC
MERPSFEELVNEDSDALNKLKLYAHKSGYELLVELDKRATKDRWLQLATSESLTAGLMMSTLVDIPWAGYLKYGCHGVYDTDAKRVFDGVTVDDVYTHRCAKEMAVGLLNNSNATITIAVTGNAMPLKDKTDQLGEVFIGIAGYKNGSIIVETHSINACIQNDIDEFKKLCKVWYDTNTIPNKYNKRSTTALMSQEIRYYTTIKSFELCLNFVKKYDPDVPDLILDRKRMNQDIDESGNHNKIPPSKYMYNGETSCKTDKCSDIISGERFDVKTGGKHKTKKSKSRRRLRTRKH